jgi:hypothetical protein
MTFRAMPFIWFQYFSSERDIDTKKVCQISTLGDALGRQYEPLLYFKIL